MKILLLTLASLLGTATAQPSIAAIAQENPQFSTLVTALQATGLDQILSVPWYCDVHRVGRSWVHYARRFGHCLEYTVFAPPNDAFAALDNTALPVSTLVTDNYLPLLADILKYHILAGAAVTSDQITDGAMVRTGNGDKITTTTNPIQINGISIIEPFDVDASNGVVHTVESVLLPPSAMRSIVDLASGLPDTFSTLVDAVVKAELVDALSGGIWTVFAPTNDAFTAAFAALGVSGLDDIDQATLTDILLYHVIPDAVVTAANVPNGSVDTGLAGAAIDVHVSRFRHHGRRITLNNNIHVIQTDLLTNNGIVHVIDGVLVPP